MLAWSTDMTDPVMKSFLKEQSDEAYKDMQLVNRNMAKYQTPFKGQGGKPWDTGLNTSEVASAPRPDAITLSFPVPGVGTVALSTIDAAPGQIYLDLGLDYIPIPGKSQWGVTFHNLKVKNPKTGEYREVHGNEVDKIKEFLKGQSHSTSGCLIGACIGETVTGDYKSRDYGLSFPIRPVGATSGPNYGIPITPSSLDKNNNYPTH